MLEQLMIAAVLKENTACFSKPRLIQIGSQQLHHTTVFDRCAKTCYICDIRCSRKLAGKPAVNVGLNGVGEDNVGTNLFDELYIPDHLIEIRKGVCASAVELLTDVFAAELFQIFH